VKQLTTLTGPSCAGKSTLESMMVERGCMKAVSTTTRLPRAGEVDGVDYYFIGADKFKTMKDCGMFIECIQFGDNFYGLSTAELNRLFMHGDHIVLVCEPVGAKQIALWCKSHRDEIQLRQVFVDNPQSVINERFLQRTINDATAAAAIGSNSHNRVIKTAAKRMEVMMTTEQAWRLEAHAYDLDLQRIDITNCVEIADMLALDFAIA